jgi:large subunit ribosomal protein L21
MLSSLRSRGVAAATSTAAAAVASALTRAMTPLARVAPELARGASSSSASSSSDEAAVPAREKESNALGRAPRPSDAFAVVALGSTQMKVTTDDLVFVEKMRNYDVNDEVDLRAVLMLGDASRTIVGRPTVRGARVRAIVEEHFRDAKKLVFKKRRRKGFQRTFGHRSELTGLRIVEIDHGGLLR